MRLPRAWSRCARTCASSSSGRSRNGRQLPLRQLLRQLLRRRRQRRARTAGSHRALGRAEHASPARRGRLPDPHPERAVMQAPRQGALFAS